MYSDLKKLKECNTDAKLAMKQWQENYKKDYGFMPSKDAFQQAPSEVRDAYKIYWKTSKQLSVLKNQVGHSLANTSSVNQQNDLTEFKEATLNEGKLISSSNTIFQDNISKPQACITPSPTYSCTSKIDDSALLIGDGPKSQIYGSYSQLGEALQLKGCKHDSQMELSKSETYSHDPAIHCSDLQVCNHGSEINSSNSTKHNSDIAVLKCKISTENNKSISHIGPHPNGGTNTLKLETNMQHNFSNVDTEMATKVQSIPASASKNIWGQHLNKRKSVNSDSINEEFSLYNKMAENMKGGQGVVKTRLSLKRVPSRLLNEKKENAHNLAACSDTITETQKRLDSYDVMSCTNQNLKNDDNFSSKVNNFSDHKIESSTTLISSVNKGTPKTNSQPVSYLSLNLVAPQRARKLNDAWVRRCSDIIAQESNLIKENCEDVSTGMVTDSMGDWSDTIGADSTQICSSTNISPGANRLKRRHDSGEVKSTGNSIKRLKRDSEDMPKIVHNSDPINLICNESKDCKPTDAHDLSDVESSTIEFEPESNSNENKQFITALNSNGATDANSEDNFEEKKNSRKRGKSDNDEIVAKQSRKSVQTVSGKKFHSKEDRLEQKMLSGKINENFVKINLKKKVFVRGKKRMRAEIYKRQEWKKKQALKGFGKRNTVSTNKSKCFKCDKIGHWARDCPGKAGDNLLPIAEYSENESMFLTLTEASDLAKGIHSHTNEVTRVETDTTKVTRLEIKTDKIIAESSEQSGICHTNIEDEIFSDWDDDVITTAAELAEAQNRECGQKLVNNDRPCDEATGNVCSIHPLYELSSEGDISSTPPEVIETLKLFGHNTFRRGQEEAIMRILSGESTLLVQSTGSGKSLCYQLPAYLYSKHCRCITICVSPLVSLMEDQVTGLPPFLKAVCVHTQQSPKSREKALTALRSGDVHILLMSPEAIVLSSRGGILRSLLKELPPVAFACIDEAHCLSEWSHNFRPSYLQVCKILEEKLHVNTFLGLTATARNDTALSIAKHLGVSSVSKGLIKGTCIPHNLKLSISRDANKEVSLIHLLTGERFEGCSSIIIYCTRRTECERIATFIRTQIVVASKINVKENAKRRRGISLDAEAYHAGLSGFRRQQIQTRFMSGKVRIVVATVAFGMGIDKADVQGIIHFNMPRNLESYVQEIGRAGRDGNTAHCHLFLDSLDGKDIQELKRHIFVNSVDRHIVRKLLGKVFVPHHCTNGNKLVFPTYTSNKNVINSNPKNKNKDKENVSDFANKDCGMIKNLRQNACPGHEVAVPIEDLVQLLDLPEENIQTLLCYLEMHESGKLKLSRNVYGSCKVSCYGGPKQLCAVSRKCPPLAAAVALQQKQGKNFDGVSSITFPVVDISSQMGWESGIVKQELKNLEWNSSAAGVKSSGIKVEFSDLAFCLICKCDLSEEEQDQILEWVYARACVQEKDQLSQLQYTYTVLRRSSHGAILLCCDAVDEAKSDTLKAAVEAYFERSSAAAVPLDGDAKKKKEEEERAAGLRPEVERQVRADVRSLLCVHSDQAWTGRAVARVFHGISSPNFPAAVWGRVRKVWRLHLQTDFNLILAAATSEILKFR